MKAQRRALVIFAAVVSLVVPPVADAQLAVSSNDNKVVNDNGVNKLVPGTLALVANRSEGTVSVFTIQGRTVTPAGKVTIADEKSGTSHATFTPDGNKAKSSPFRTAEK
jgi:hypothetical protein